MIDFLQQLPENNKPPFSGQLIIKILAVVVIITIAIIIYNYVKLAKSSELIAQKQTELDKLITHEQKLKTENPEVFASTSLLKQIEAKQLELTAVEQQLAISKGGGEPVGFSKYLYVLANNTPAEIWLDRIYIDLVNKDINIQGSSSDKALLPGYMDIINTKLDFNNSLVDIFNIKDDQFSENAIFQIGTMSLAENNYKQKQSNISTKDKLQVNKTGDKKNKKIKRLTEMKNYYITEKDKIRKVIRGYSGY